MRQVDLRNDKCMPPVRQQGKCGSCWAFAAITPLEYKKCKKTGSLTLLRYIGRIIILPFMIYYLIPLGATSASIQKLCL